MSYQPQPMTEINITSLVDVTMVLLIVFMITAPMMKQGFEVELPKASAAAFEVDSEESVTLTIKEDGSHAINGTTVPDEELPLALDEAFKLRSDKTLFIEAHKDVRYEPVIKAMDVARRLELKMSLIYEPESTAKALKEQLKQSKQKK